MIVRDPLVGEFFATSTIRNLADSIVREGIQNSLDVGLRDEHGQFQEPVRIHIQLRRGDDATPATTHREFFSGIWPHIIARGNGLNEDEVPRPSDECPCLVFEDFNTVGLTGDVEQDRDLEGVKNNFFHFFRAEGRSGKAGDERGRWGVGKYVFPRASRIKTVVAFTKRRDDSRELLMGRSILRSHAIDGRDFLPDGHFGCVAANLESDGMFVLPVENAQALDTFRAAFGLTRRDEPGTSLVVPWVDEAVTLDDLVSAVVAGYFIPLLDGSLVVTLRESTRTVVLDADTFVDEARRAHEGETAALAELAAWAEKQKPETFVKLARHPRNEPRWSDAIFPDDYLHRLKHSLAQPVRRAIVEVPMRVKRKHEESQESYFRVYLEEDRKASGKVVFVRGGILISDVRAPKVPGVRAIVVAEHRSLTALLGDAENPAHTQWQRDSSNFRGKYDHGPASLAFVVQSASKILEALTAKDEQGDPTLLADVFFLDEPGEETEPTGGRKPTGKEKPNTESEKPTVPPPSKRYYRIQSARGGFSLLPGTIPPPVLPCRLTIDFAYDVRKGNPFERYREDDFRVLSPPVRIDGREEGLKIVRAGTNQLEVELRRPAFGLTLAGFDTRRDLIVRVREAAPTGDDSTN